MPVLRHRGIPHSNECFTMEYRGIARKYRVCLTWHLTPSAASRVHVEFLDTRLEFMHVRSSLAEPETEEDGEHKDSAAPATKAAQPQGQQEGGSAAAPAPAFTAGAAEAVAESQLNFGISPTEVAEEYTHLPTELAIHLTKLKVGKINLIAHGVLHSVAPHHASPCTTSHW